MPMKAQSRQLADWLEGFVRYMDNSESSRSYIVWSAISAIGTTLQRRVWMQWGHTRIFPNQYIALIGPSGNRKAEPLMVAREFVAGLGVSIIPEEITRQGLYKQVKESVSTYTDPETRVLVPHCSVYGSFEELAVFLGEGDSRFLAVLTNWYDSRDAFDYRSKGGGLDDIRGVCLNILGSMAPDWIPMCIPTTAQGGGFTSRFIFVVDYNKGKTITNPNLNPPDPKLYTALKHDLELMFTFTGPYVFDSEAQELYSDWYTQQEELIRAGGLPVPDMRLAGYNTRRQTHVKKIAMIVCASRSNRRVITAPDFLRAASLIEQVEVNMPGIFGGIGQTDVAQRLMLVRDVIKAQGKIKKSDLMRRHFRDISLRDLYEIEATLEVMGLVHVDRKQGRDVIYTWKG